MTFQAANKVFYGFRAARYQSHPSHTLEEILEETAKAAAQPSVTLEVNSYLVCQLRPNPAKMSGQPQFSKPFVVAVKAFSG